MRVAGGAEPRVAVVVGPSSESAVERCSEFADGAIRQRYCVDYQGGRQAEDAARHLRRSFRVHALSERTAADTTMTGLRQRNGRMNDGVPTCQLVRIV